MKKTTAVFTAVVFLLFTISAAFRPLSITTIHHDDHVSNGVISSTKSIDPINGEDRMTATTRELSSFPVESESTTQTLFVTRRPISFSRSNQFNRHIYNDHPRIPLRFVRRHPCRNYFRINNNNNQPSLEAAKSREDVVVLTSDDHVPSKLFEFKQEYGHHRHHHDNVDNESGPTYEIDGDKLQMHRHHRHQHKGVGFMRAIRKFIKHAFD